MLNVSVLQELQERKSLGTFEQQQLNIENRGNDRR